MCLNWSTHRSKESSIWWECQRGGKEVECRFYKWGNGKNVTRRINGIYLCINTNALIFCKLIFSLHSLHSLVNQLKIIEDFQHSSWRHQCQTWVIMATMVSILRDVNRYKQKKKGGSARCSWPLAGNTRLCPEVLSQEKAKEESYLNIKFGGMKISLRVQKNLPYWSILILSFPKRLFHFNFTTIGTLYFFSSLTE